jgi:hypothetical protein
MKQLGLFRDLQISCQDLKVLQDDLSDFGDKEFLGQIEWRTKFYEHCDMMKWENVLKKYENQVLEIWEKYFHPVISDMVFDELKQEIKGMFYKNMEKVLKLNPTEKGFAISIYRADIVSKMIFAIDRFGDFLLTEKNEEKMKKLCRLFAYNNICVSIFFRLEDIDKGIIYVFLPEIFRKSFSLNHLDGKYGKNDFLHFTYT